MASTSLQEAIEFWNQLIEYADVMQKQTTGAEDVTWTAPNGETGKSFLKFSDIYQDLRQWKLLKRMMQISLPVLSLSLAVRVMITA